MQESEGASETSEELRASMSQNYFFPCECCACFVPFGSPKMVTTMTCRIITERTNEIRGRRRKTGIFIRTNDLALITIIVQQWLQWLKGDNLDAQALVQKHMPDFSSSEHANLVAYTPAVRTTSLKTGGPYQQGISRARCRRQGVWSWKAFSRYSPVHVLELRDDIYRAGIRPEPCLRRLGFLFAHSHRDRSTSCS